MSANAEESVAPVTDEQARKLLVDLVSIPSPTGEEQAAAERLAAFFEAHDREVWIDEVGNVRAPADDSVLLTSHVDTVPGEIPVHVAPQEQRDEGGASEARRASGRSSGQGPREETAGVLWGRGSVDATGPLAAMAVAAVRTGVSFVGVVGEETDSRGARYLVEDREEPEAVVNGEPSGTDGITLGYRGFLAGEYTVSTDSVHTSRPEANAIQEAMEWWQTTAEKFDTTETYDDTSVFGQVTAKPVEFSGGTAEDGLSVEASVTAQFRIPPDETAESIQEVVEDELSGGKIEWADPIPPVMESPRTDVARAFRVAIRRVGGDPRLLRKTGTSDMNLYAGAWDCPMATYGPGDSELDHAPNEHLDLGEFERATSVLESVATDCQS